MAEKKTATEETAVAEPTYTVEEIIQAAESFGTSPDIIRAAFSEAGIEESTESDAKKLIERFRKKEVK